MIMPWEKAGMKNKCDGCKHVVRTGVDELGISCEVTYGYCFEGSEWEPNDEVAARLQQSAKSDTGKSRVDLVSPYLIEATGHVRRYGVEKYGDPDNWKQVDKERYIAALLRHLCEVMKDFKSIDPESGLPHLWHVDCNANFLTEILAMEMEGVSE